MSAPGSESDLLIAFVREALLAQARGEPIQPTLICSARPDLAPALAEALGLVDELAVLQRAAAATDPLAGHLLAGRYRLQQSLGRGAMGVVYRARDQELQRDVAVKILDVRLFHDEVAEQRFQREAELLAALRHPHVVAVHDRGRTPEGIHFLVMDLLEGAPLAAILQRLEQGGDPLQSLAALGVDPTEANWPRQCARWGGDLADGLDAAHRVGVVHRDVKPSNVFVARDGGAVLLDFGIAARSAGGRLTATETTLGTPWYMAPEQVRAGGAPPAPAQDLYGLCATLYHLATGRPPYQGDSAAVLAALPVADPVPVRKARASVPRDLAAIVERGMERSPQRRYRDARALALDLRAFLAHEPVTARPIGVTGRWWRAAARRPARALAAAALVLLALALAVGVPLWRAQQERQRREQRAELLARLPTLIAVEGQPAERLLDVLAAEHRDGERLLSAILELDPEDLPTRLLRACLRLDLGDPAGSAADFARIAAAEGSPYVAELARRYAAIDRSRRGTEAVDCAGLPAPQSAADRFVAGFHELRNRHVPGFADRAIALLEAAAPEQPAARDHLLIALAAKADATPPGPERTRLFQRLADEGALLEGVYGRPTARTLAMRGVAMIGLKRYVEAVPLLEASLVLRPGRHAPLQNLGIALRRCGRLELAEQRLQQALAVRPFAWNTAYTLAQVARDREDFAAAYAWAAKVPVESRDELDWKQPHLVGWIAVHEAVTLFGRDPEHARAAAARAAAAYAQAATAPSAVAVPARQQLLQVHAQLAQALQAEDLETALLDYLNVTRRAPDDPYTIAIVAHLLPPRGFGPQQSWMLGIWLRELARAQAGSDEQLWRQLGGEIEELAGNPPR